MLPAVRPTLLDRMIGYVSPSSAPTRYRDRVQFAAAARFFGPGQYNGAKAIKPSLSNWWPFRGGPNSDSLPDRPTLIARSADLERNEPLATGAISTTVTPTVGTGLRATVAIDRKALGLSSEEADEWERQADAYFEHWAESKAADVAGLLNFYQQQELVLRGQLVRGDVAAIRRFVERSSDLFATRLQLLEGDRVSTPDGQVETATLLDGVEMDRDGRHIRYHVLEEHPGESVLRRWVPVVVSGAESGLRHALLVARIIRIGQVRGVPILAPVIELLKQLARYTAAELMAAVVTSFFTVFLKTKSGDGGYASERWVVPSLSDPDRPMPATTFGKHYKEIVERAGMVHGQKDLAGVVFHTLRHTFASWLAMRGVDLYAIAQLLGDSLQMVEKTCAHLSGLQAVGDRASRRSRRHPHPS